jgi:hypothetical protein
MRLNLILCIGLSFFGNYAKSQEDLSTLRSQGISLESLSNLQRFNLDYTISDLNPDSPDSLLLIQLPLELYEKYRLIDEDKILWSEEINKELTLFSLKKTLNNIELNQIRVSRIEGSKSESFVIE